MFEMEFVFEGIPMLVSTDGTIKMVVKHKGMQTIDGLMDVDGSLKVCVGNRYYKIQDIIATAFLNYDIRERNRVVKHINKNATDNSVYNLIIENIELKRKLGQMEI